MFYAFLLLKTSFVLSFKQVILFDMQWYATYFPFHSCLFFKIPYHLPNKYFLFAILIFQSIVYPKVKHDNAPSESHVTNVDDDTNCSTGNTVNLDEENDLPYDMLEALER